MPSEGLFGTRLRLERERRGVTLETVAHYTKVSQSLFAEMERGDFTRWPPGIFGRAFIRGYAEAVGLDADVVVAQFGELFPAAADTEIARSTMDRVETPGALAWADEFRASGDGPAAIGAMPDATLRLVLAEDEAESRWRRRANRSSLRLAAAGFDVAVVLAMAGLITVVGGVAAFVPAVAICSLGWAALGSVAVGGSPALWYLRGRLRVEEAAEPAEMVHAAPATRRAQDLIVNPNYYRPSNDRRVRHA